MTFKAKRCASNVPNPALGEDCAWTRHLNDDLRKYGRGGVVAVSLTLVSAGEDVVVEALRAVASADPATSHSDGRALSGIGILSWSISRSAGTRILSVWLSEESL